MNEIKDLCKAKIFIKTEYKISIENSIFWE
jgi:hypothetical protein